MRKERLFAHEQEPNPPINHALLLGTSSQASQSVVLSRNTAKASQAIADFKRKFDTAHAGGPALLLVDR